MGELHHEVIDTLALARARAAASGLDALARRRCTTASHLPIDASELRTAPPTPANNTHCIGKTLAFERVLILQPFARTGLLHGTTEGPP